MIKPLILDEAGHSYLGMMFDRVREIYAVQSMKP